MKEISIENIIIYVRGYRVIIDTDLAKLYDVKTKVLLQAVKRNISRFPQDFMFQLTEDEFRDLRTLFINSNKTSQLNQEVTNLRSQFVTSSSNYGGRRFNPYVFTEQGVAMLSSVLSSEKAVQVNIEIMRAFVKLKAILGSNEELSRKVTALEKKYDSQFKIIFDAIRELMKPPDPKKRPIGFGKP